MAIRWAVRMALEARLDLLLLDLVLPARDFLTVLRALALRASVPYRYRLERALRRRGRSGHRL